MARKWKLPRAYLADAGLFGFRSRPRDITTLEEMAVEDASNDYIGEDVPIPEGWEEFLAEYHAQYVRVLASIKAAARNASDACSQQTHLPSARTKCIYLGQADEDEGHIADPRRWKWLGCGDARKDISKTSITFEFECRPVDDVVCKRSVVARCDKVARFGVPVPKVQKQEHLQL